MCLTGITIFLRRKFSASQFWDDCRKYNVTVMQYIGETMRYLCNSPKVTPVTVSPKLTRPLASSLCFHSVPILLGVFPPQKDNEKSHKVRVAIGNGVRTDVWTEFLNRFGNIQVRELYAATEGNIGFINYTSKVGTVGRVNLVHRVSPHYWSPKWLV